MSMRSNIGFRYIPADKLLLDPEDRDEIDIASDDDRVAVLDRGGLDNLMYLILGEAGFNPQNKRHVQLRAMLYARALICTTADGREVAVLDEQIYETVNKALRAGEDANRDFFPTPFV